MFEHMVDQFEGAREVEAVCDALVEGGADVDEGALTHGPVRHFHEFVPHGSYGDHDAVGAVIVQVMVDGRAFDASEIAEQDA